jgi:hypothetical protein
MGHSAGLGAVQKIKFLTVPELELRPLGHAALRRLLLAKYKKICLYVNEQDGLQAIFQT